MRSKSLPYQRFLYVLTVSILLMHNSAFSQKAELAKEHQQIPFAEMDCWFTRDIKESKIIGGTIKHLFEIGDSVQDTRTIASEIRNIKSPWATTNLHAKMGVNIGQECVLPEARGSGYCCRMESNLREINVLGLKINALIAGAIFLGELNEPVRNFKEPTKKMAHGIPFCEKPKAIKFDYKYKAGDKRYKATHKKKDVEGRDMGELCLLLQKRFEDEHGNISALRIGGTRCFFNETNGWVNDTTVNIVYGDITNEDFFEPAWMGLIPEVQKLYVKNSSEKLVPLVEKGWAETDEIPTHLVLYFTSSYEGVDFIGSPESILWVDNIELVY